MQNRKKFQNTYLSVNVSMSELGEKSSATLGFGHVSFAAAPVKVKNLTL